MLAEIFFKRLQQAIVFKKEGEMNNGQEQLQEIYLKPDYYWLMI